MSQRKTPFAVDEYYHIYNRGNSKQIIFKDEADRARFQQLLYVMNSEDVVVFKLLDKGKIYEYERKKPLVAIGAYCLMPNHFHILLTPIAENGIQMFMQKLSTGYSMYFNKKYERTGALFEGRFRSQHVADDRYLKYLFSYIHLNPIKLLQSDWREGGIKDIRAAKQYLDSYSFSSLKDYAGFRKENVILALEKFPEYFKEKTEVDAELLEWLTYDTAVA